MEQKLSNGTSFFDADIEVDGVTALDVSADQRVVAVGSSNRIVLGHISGRYDSVQIEKAHYIDGAHRRDLKPILRLKFSPTLALSKYLASSSISGAIAVWNIERATNSDIGYWAPDFVLKEHTQPVSSLCWHYGNPHTLLTGSHDTTAKLWDLRVRDMSTLTFHSKASVRDLQFRKVLSAQKFAAALSNGSVQVWDVRHAKNAEIVFAAHDVAYTVDWNPMSSNFLASGGRDGIIKVWDIFERESQQAPSIKTGQNDLSAKSVNFAKESFPQYSFQPSSHVKIREREIFNVDPAKSRTGTGNRKRKTHHHFVKSIETTERGLSQVFWRPENPSMIASVHAKKGTIMLWNTECPRVPVAILEPQGMKDSVVSFAWIDQCLQKKDVFGSSLCGTQWWSDDEEEGIADDLENSSVFGDDLRSGGGNTSTFGPPVVYSGGSPSAAHEYSQARVNSTTGFKNAGFGSRASTLNPSDVMSIAESGMSGDRMDSVLSDDIEQRKQAQRSRFRQFKHKGVVDDSRRPSWSLILSCTFGGTIKLYWVQNAFIPLKKFRSSAFDISCRARMAALFSKIEPARITVSDNSKTLTNRLATAGEKINATVYELYPEEVNTLNGADFSSRSILSKALKKSNLPTIPDKAWNLESMDEPEKRHTSMKSLTLSKLMLGFDPEQFSILAYNYATPDSLIERAGASCELDISSEFAGRSLDVIDACCAHNALIADSAQAPEIAQLWRLIRTFFVPRTSTSLLAEALHDIHVKDRNAASVFPRNVNPFHQLPGGEDAFLNSPSDHGSNYGSLPFSEKLNPDFPAVAWGMESPIAFLGSLGGESLQSGGHKSPPSSPKANRHTINHRGGGVESPPTGTNTLINDAAVNVMSLRDKQLNNAQQSSKDAICAKREPGAKVLIVPEAVSDGSLAAIRGSGLWLDKSLGLLHRLNMQQPLDDFQFVRRINGTLENDRLELLDTLSRSMPQSKIVPRPEGHQWQRRQQRQNRQRRYLRFHASVHDRHLLKEQQDVLPSTATKSRDDGAISSGALKPPSPRNNPALSGGGIPGFPIGASKSDLFYETISKNMLEAARCELLRKMLEFHADIGDVQTCAMIILVMGNNFDLQIEKRRSQQWLCSYIDQLQQLQLFSEAARIISACRDSDVDKCYKMPSMIAEGCGNCHPESKKNVLRTNSTNDGVCLSCRKPVSLCSICEERVYGMYVWCQGCGHGGHFEHLNEWFKDQHVCPTGCGHVCTISGSAMF